MGPWPWPVRDKATLYTFLLVAQTCLLLGYAWAVRSPKILRIKYRGTRLRLIDPRSLGFVRLLMVVSFGVLLLNIWSGSTATDGLTGMVRQVLAGLQNPGERYHEKLLNYASTESNLLLLLAGAVAAPLKWLFVPLAVWHWNGSKWWDKLGVTTYLLMDTARWVAIGTNKGVFDNVIVVIASLLISLYGRRRNVRRTPRLIGRWMIFGVLAVSLVALAITFMTHAITSRLGTVRYDNTSLGIQVNVDSPIMRLVPRPYHGAMVIVSSYLTQGYYGLSLALNEDFTPTYGFGNSFLLHRVYEMLTGDTDLIQQAYPFKLVSYGWDPYINWHSLYTWLASDFSFTGTLFVMLILGFGFGAVWKSIIVEHNVYAMGLFTLYMLLFVYVPANNQVFAFIETFSAFWGLLILWLFSRVKPARG